MGGPVSGGANEATMREASWRRWQGVAAAVALMVSAAPARAQDVPQTMKQKALATFVAPLSSVPLLDPGPQYVADRTAAQVLGKALFWDAQLGSDGQACASCHFHAGADNRSKNQVNPGFRNAGVAGGDMAFGNSPLPGVATPSFGPNYQLTLADFPLHKVADDTNARSRVLSDTNDVVSSQGVFAALFEGVGTSTDKGHVDAKDAAMGGLVAAFKVGDGIVRSVAPRNTPSAVNAPFNRRNFWDGRARDEFNGANPIGSLDTVNGKSDATAAVVSVDASGVPRLVYPSVAGSSAASQAVGPPLSDVEMSYHGRGFADLGRKMLAPGLHTLAQQLVAPDDSLLGAYSAQRIAPGVKGISARYEDLVKQAFPPQWWNAPGWKVDLSTGKPVLAKTAAVGPKLFTVMEYNFPFFFGFAVGEYEKTLRSDDTPFDRFLRGDSGALGPKELIGLDVFMTRGRCKECHGGPLFSNASIAAQDTKPLATDQLLPPHNIERMINGSPCSPEEQATGTCTALAITDPASDPVVGVYDAGFYNIGVRPTMEDLGIGTTIGPDSLPLSHVERYSACLQKSVAQLQTFFGLETAIRVANDAQHCAVPHIAARPIEAATVLSKAWTLATLNGLPPATSMQIGDLIAQAKGLVTGEATEAAVRLAACSLGTACPGGTPGLLFQARDLLAANVGAIVDPAVQERVAKLLPLATNLLPDVEDPGPTWLLAYAPPLRPDEHCNVRGAFKVPGLRNVALTGPFFHNGGQATLAQVVQFYDRGGDFTDANMPDLAPNVARIALLPYEEEGLLAFLDALTDERVRWERAPFDHPSLSIPNGGTVGLSTLLGEFTLFDDRIELPAVGADGHPVPLGTPGTPLANFPDPVWSRIAPDAGAGQQAAPGAALPANLAVRIVDADGKPVAGVPVTFTAPKGGSVSARQVTTGADGRAAVTATLGPDAGAQVFTAEAYAVVGSPLAIQATAARATGASPPPVGPVAQGGCATGQGADLSALLLAAAALLARFLRSRLPRVAVVRVRSPSPRDSPGDACVARGGEKRLRDGQRTWRSRGPGRGALVALFAAATAMSTLACGGSGGSGGVDAAKSTLTVSPVAVLADGATAAAISLTARDARGRLLAGQPVKFAVSGDANAIAGADATTGSDGSASAAITSSAVGAKTVTATVGGVALTAPVEFVPWEGCRLCGAACFDFATDASNCGACSHACAQGEVCSAGKCGAVSCSTLKLPGAVPAALVGLDPSSIASGDLDGDGIPDLVVADAFDRTVSILFGNGDGTFESRLKVLVGNTAAASPASVAVADLNGDGQPDIVVANHGEDTVTILLGAGAGTRWDATTIAVGSRPSFVAIADLDGDGRPDLVVANHDAGTVGIFLNRIAPSAPRFVRFVEPVAAYPVVSVVGVGPVAVAVADLDGDGRPDVAVASDDDTAVVLHSSSAGDGTFTVGAPVDVGAGPTSIAAADLDGDGSVDLAVANGLDGTVTVLLNPAKRGVLVAQPPIAIGTIPTSPVALAAVDLDGDGGIDLAVVDGKAGNVAILLNGGGAAFAPAQTYAAGFIPSALLARDLDGDGKPDLAIATGAGNAVTVLANVGSGVFGTAASAPARPVYGAGAGPQAIAVADLDGDGKAEVMVAEADDGTQEHRPVVTVLRNRGDGVLAEAGSYPGAAGATAMVVADLDGDGALDVALTAGDSVIVLAGRAGAAFAAPVRFPAGAAGSKAVALVAADLNGDGKLDLAVVTQGEDAVNVLLNAGGGAFAASVPYPAGSAPAAIAAADLDGDGFPDLAVANGGDGTATVLLNRRDGTFATRQPVFMGKSGASGPIAIVAADLDGDGRPDLAVANNRDPSVSIALNTTSAAGAASFATRVIYDVAVSPTFMAAGDLDLDGSLDLVVASAPLASLGKTDGYRAVTVLRNEGSGTFFERAFDHLLVTPLALAAADLDGNGRKDVVLAGTMLDPATGQLVGAVEPLFSACAP